jgi:hypothetical protein
MQAMTQVAVQSRQSPSPVRLRWVFIAAAVAFAVLLAAGLTIWVVATRGGDRSHSIAGPVGDRQAASLDVAGGATAVTVRTENLGDDLYRVTTPEESATVPSIVDGDLVNGERGLRLELSGGGPGVVDIRLSDRVVWSLRFSGGAEHIEAQLGAARLSLVEFAGGTHTIDLTLPPPTGELPVRMSGGADQFAVHVPPKVAARLDAGGGAGTVTLDGVTHLGVGKGGAYATDDWITAKDRYAIYCTAGMSVFMLDREQ